ncbi:maleylpyruvate isomerase family mycothiol-dependent enzyme [Nocardioides marinquilinus]|uniref:Maleylpyruvate isomerase family mycothiol-dependent enzyme n=1 Tax=Nocardioides marinquilinus TaxID=1210400 RepID=A0ABP9P5F2_9ACTN
MAEPDLMQLAERERSSLAALLEGLTQEQWRAPSLCRDWSVRDVAVHVVGYDELGAAGTAKAFVRGGVRVDSVNRYVLERYADLDTAGVVAMVVRCRRPRGLTAGFGGGIALTDGTIHQQDIRRALSIPREIPEAQLVSVLDFALKAPTLPGRRNARRLHLAATDVDWSHGSGPRVDGPAEALLMAVAGRPDALGDLSGDGLPTLRARLR